MIYFIQSGPDGRVKIGCAHNPARRIATLKCASPYPVEVLAIWEGGFEVEKTLHHFLSAHRVHGEWFAPHAEVLAAANECPAVAVKAKAKGRPNSALKDYLAQPGQTASALASKCDVAVSTITRAAGREFDPSMKLMRKIEMHTGGKVKPNDFLSEAQTA